jgi:hypothetical protein
MHTLSASLAAKVKRIKGIHYMLQVKKSTTFIL